MHLLGGMTSMRMWEYGKICLRNRLEHLGIRRIEKLRGIFLNNSLKIVTSFLINILRLPGDCLRKHVCRTY